MKLIKTIITQRHEVAKNNDKKRNRQKIIVDTEIMK
jgi:hypothetical protein